MNDDFENWVLDRLSALLGLPVEELGEMMPMLLSFNARPQVEDHLYGILGRAQNVTTFVNEFCSKRFHSPSSVSSAVRPSLDLKSSSPQLAPSKPILSQFKNQENIYRKNDNDLVYFAGGKKKALSVPPESKEAPVLELPNNPMTIPDTQQTAQPMNKKARKERAKAAGITLAEFDRLTTVDGAYAGSNRIVCDCMASKHDLLTNCLTCGRIICNLEGPGDCFTCDTLVVSKEQQRTLLGKRMVQGFQNTENDAAFQASQQFLLQQALERAEQTKERLLEYDRNSTARTKVHDVASDFDFDAAARDKWSSSEERQQAAKKAQQKRIDDEQRSKRRVMTIDVANKRVTVEVPDDREVPIESNIPTNTANRVGATSSITAQSSSEDGVQERSDPGSTGLFVNPTLVIRPEYVHVELPAGKVERRKRPAINGGRNQSEESNENFIPGLGPTKPAVSARKKSISKAPAGINANNAEEKTTTSSRMKNAKPRLQTDFEDTSATIDITPNSAFDRSIGEEPPCG